MCWSRNKDLSSVTLATIWTTKASPMQRGAHLLRSFTRFSNAFCLFLGALPPPSPASPPHRCSRRRTKSTKNPQGFSLKFGIRCFSCNVAFASGVSHGAWRSPSVLVYTFFQCFFATFSMVLHWARLALAWLWVCLMSSFVHFSNTFWSFWRARHLPCSVALALCARLYTFPPLFAY